VVARGRFTLCVSQVVLDEARQRDPDVAAQRLRFAQGLPVLNYTDDVTPLALVYQSRVRLPAEVEVDLTHVALATVHETDYLVTWNCAHIANAQVVRKIAEVNRELGRFMPPIVTPEGFMDVLSGEER